MVCRLIIAPSFVHQPLQGHIVIGPLGLGCNIGCTIRKREEMVRPLSDTESTTCGFCTDNSGPGGGLPELLVSRLLGIPANSAVGHFPLPLILDRLLHCRDSVLHLSADRGLTPFSAPQGSSNRIGKKKRSSRSR